jgi:hypothetical protein
MRYSLEDERRSVVSRNWCRSGVASLLVLLVLACGDDQSTNIEVVSGTFPLIAYANKPLPAFQAPIPTRDGSPSQCNIVVSEGFLSLDPASDQFGFEYVTRNSCTQAQLSSFGESGQLEQEGRHLRLSTHFPAAPDRDRTFVGTIGVDEITVLYHATELTFRR